MALSIFRKDRYNDTENAKFITDRIFYLVIAAVLFFGFFVNAMEVIFLSDVIFTFVDNDTNAIWFLVAYIVMAVAGICINAFCRNPVLSFIGYCLVVLPIGAELALIVPQVSFGVVRSAFIVTAILTAIFMLLALVYPKVFASIWKLLAISLFIALIWSVVCLFTGDYFSSTYVWLDWLVVLIFCCYIGFDISFARNRPKTMKNAINSACGLYLDIINVFLRLLIIFGDRD